MAGCDHDVRFELIGGSRSRFDVIVHDPKCRILSVRAPYIKRWEEVRVAIDDKAASAPPLDAKDKGKAPNTMRSIRVWLEKAVEGSWTLSIQSETDMAGTTGKGIVPAFEARDVARETGYVAVCAKTNVEVDEHQSIGLGRIDVSELPSEVSNKASYPMLLSYKFLAPGYGLVTNVTRHDDVGVLIASADGGWITMTLAEESWMVRAHLTVRNTIKQYLRTALPKDSTLWSCSVAGETVKPAADREDQRLMIPMQKSSDVKDAKFDVELVFITPNPKLGDGVGNVSLLLPVFDVPVNMLFVKLVLPRNYWWNDWDGSLTQVRSWSKGEPAKGSTASPLRAHTNRAPQMQQQMLHSNLASTNFYANTWNDDFDDLLSNVDEQIQIQSMPKKKVMSNRSRGANKSVGGWRKGVMPVTVDIPETGFPVFFERLLVMENAPALSLKGSYTKRSKEEMNKINNPKRSRGCLRTLFFCCR